MPSPPCSRPLFRIGGLACTALFVAVPAGAAEVHGLIALGTAAADARSDSFTESMDKSPFGIAAPAGRLTVRVDGAPFGDFRTSITADADSQRSSVIDVQEAWVGWKPVPESPWRFRARAGAFFPVSSVEVGYDSIGWNAERTLSSSAINSWIAEEIRIVGAEFTLQWRGVMVDSPHTLTARFGAFGGNDPAGTELAWRGWNVGGHVTGLFQQLRLPDLPVYRRDGPIPQQSRTVHVLREIDHRPGGYASLGYGYDEWLDVEAMHYDNRGDPLRITNGQYSWHTRFDHLSVKAHFSRGWQVSSQVLKGRTIMGPNVVQIRFSSWYLLASRPLGPGIASIRSDHFHTRDLDMLPSDANQERGHAWAMAYSFPLRRNLRLVAEVLRVDSNRSARSLIGMAPRRVEDSLGIELRRAF
jgi:hypothetical protein